MSNRNVAETSQKPLTLAKWCQQLPFANSRQHWLIVLLRVANFAVLIYAFWWFAQVIQHFLIAQVRPAEGMLWHTILMLLLAWALKGAAVWLSQRGKAKFEKDLQQQVLQRFAHDQHALLRQQSAYYWQAIWLHHIPALRDWRYDYQIQQYVAGLTPLLIIAAVLPVNYVIGLTLLLSMPLVPVFMILVGMGAAKAQRKQFVALERLGTLFVDRLQNLPLLATFAGFGRQISLLARASGNLNRRTMKVVSLAFLSNTVLDFFSTVAMALVAVFIGFNLLGEIRVGPDIRFADGLWLLLSAPLVFNELKLLGQFYHQKSHAETAFGELKTHLPAPLPQHKPASFVGLAWQDFYLPLIELRAASLTLKPGQRVALQGQSGAGKTLLLEALAGQRPASHSLPAQVAFYTQSPVILPSSIRANLCMGRRVAEADLFVVLDQVGLLGWLNQQTEGLDTEMGEHPPLSGGQAQRLALARLLLHPAQIWLLDEPTAHLTDEQHQALSALINAVAGQRTVIWASHKHLPPAWFTQTWLISEQQILVGGADE